MRRVFIYSLFLLMRPTISLCKSLQPSIRWWEPHIVSEGTICLFHFDAENTRALSDASVHTASVECVGDIALTREGRFASALAVNGRAGGVKVMPKAPLPGTERLAVEAWVYLDSYPESEGYLLYHPHVAGKQNEWTLFVDQEGRLTMSWLPHNTPKRAKEALSISTSPGTVPVRIWTHVAGVFRHNNKATLYVNGVEKASRLFLNAWGIKDGLPTETTAGTIWIGNTDTMTCPWPGCIDELRISCDVLRLFARPDNSWTDPQCRRPLTRGTPYTPDDANVLLCASFDHGLDADLARGERKAEPIPRWYGLPVSDLQPGVRGQGVRYGVSFQQKGNINLKEGTLEFWFQPVNWTNIHSYHVGIFHGPFMIYTLNTGVVWPGGVPMVTWFNDRTYLCFGGVFFPEDWRHVVMSWREQEVRAYLDGERVNTGGPEAGTLEKVAGPWPLCLGGNNVYDELYVYDRMLSDDEIANCYWRYRDTTRLKPVPEIRWQASYLAGLGGIRAEVDGSRNPQAKQLRHHVTDTRGKCVWRGPFHPMPEPGREIVEKLPFLQDGEYSLHVTFVDEEKTQVSAASRSFRVKHFAWERNDIGKKPIIVPPYTPISLAGQHLRPWGRDIRLNKEGLPAQINVLGSDLLAAPMRIEAELGGSRQTLVGRKVSIRDVPGLKVLNADDYTNGPLTGAIPPLQLTPTPGYQTQVAADGQLASLATRTQATLDIDGWYQIRITLTPQKPTTLERLELICDLTPDADTLYAQVRDASKDPNGYVNSSGEFGEIRKGDGEVWTSKVLHSGARWKSFVPQVFVGTGERGLWWLAESDDGWVLADDVPCVAIERYPDRVRLRVCIIAAKTLLTQPCSFEFALLPEPVKPMLYRWRELAWMRGESNRNYYTHDTCGYRYYGDSVDSYALHTEEDFAALKAFFTKFAEQTPYYNWYEWHHGKGLREGVPHTLYGSTWMTGLGMEEFKYYGPEWLGSENWKPIPDLSFEGVPSYGNTYRWTTPEQLSAVRVNFDRAHTDCFIWYHKRLLERCPVNGTWWDNSSIGTFYEYVPGRGKIEKWNTFLRRELTRRLCIMCYEIGRRPWWLQNMHVDFSWCQVGWHIENDFYIQGNSRDLIDQLGVHKFRALTRTKGGLLNQLHSNSPLLSFSEEENRKAARTIIGLCLLHDVGERGLPRWRKQEAQLLTTFLDPLEKSVGFFSGDPEFIPYWRQNIVDITTPGVYASFFAGNGNAAVVLLNTSRQDVVVKDFSPRTQRLALKSIARIFDAENGKTLEKQGTSWRDTGESGVKLESHGVRLLIIEGAATRTGS